MRHYMICVVGLPKIAVFKELQFVPGNWGGVFCWWTRALVCDQGEEAAYAAALTSLAKLGTHYVDLLLIHWPGTAGTLV